LMVWLMRVLIIGTFSMAGARLFSLAEVHPALAGNTVSFRSAQAPARLSTLPRPDRPAGTPFRPAPKPEPTYHPVGSMAASPHNADLSVRN
jgi:hypothetical protein